MPEPTDPAPKEPQDPKPETKDVTINGQTFVLPTDEADRLIAVRDDMTKSFNHVNSERETLADQLKSIETQKAEAEKDLQKKTAVEKGELENLQQIHAKELSTVQEQLAAKDATIANMQLTSIVSVRPDIPEIARGDAARLIKADVAEIIEVGGKTHFKDHQGNLSEASTFVSKWLDAHPAFKAMQVGCMSSYIVYFASVAQ